MLNKAAGYSVDVGGVKWAYRKSEPAAAKTSPDKLPVLLLHGLGSSSWSYRYGVYASQQLPLCPTGSGVGDRMLSQLVDVCNPFIECSCWSEWSRQHSVCVLAGRHSSSDIGPCSFTPAPAVDR